MPTITATAEDITIEDRDDVKALLREAFDYKREALEREDDIQQETKSLRDEIAALEKEVEAIQAKSEDYLERRQNAIEERIKAIKAWAEDHQQELLKGASGKTFETTFGAVQYKKRRFNFDWIDKEAAIDHLKKLGHSDLVRVQEKVYKRDLKKLPELCKELKGVEPHPEGDEANVELSIG